MEEVDETSLFLRLGFGVNPLNSQSLPLVEPSLSLGVSGENHGSLRPLKRYPPFKTARKPSSPGYSTISSFSTATYIIKEDTDSRKKLRLTKQQSALLEDRFKEHTTLSLKQKQALANQLNLRPRQVEVWFQNRRARTKLKQKEIDLEFLKRCFETLKEENLRLHKELKSLKLAPPPPPLFMQLPTAAAAATLTVCPSCERNMARLHVRN